MGLAIVELVLAVEEAFSIETTDEEWESVATVGDIYLLVLDKVGIDLRGNVVLMRPDADAETPQWTPHAAWETLQAFVAEHFNVSPDAVTFSARLVDDLGMI